MAELVTPEELADSFDFTCIECGLRFLRLHAKRTSVIGHLVDDWSPDYRRAVCARLEAER